MEAQLFQSLTTEVVNKGKYINPKLNMYGDKIAVKYHDGKEIPYDKHCIFNWSIADSECL